jgi:hypothetical protein
MPEVGTLKAIGAVGMMAAAVVVVVTCVWKLVKESFFSPDQGDQIGWTSAQWAVVYYEKFSLKLQK